MSRRFSIVLCSLAAFILLSPTDTRPDTSPRLSRVDRDVLAEWDRLITRGGCLTGSQDWSPKGVGEGSSLKEEHWTRFLRIPARKLVPLLINRLESTRRTSVHVCPFSNAREGELAVYVLQHALKVNWFCIESFNSVLVQAKLDHKKRRQAAIQVVLRDRKALNELKRYFTEHYRRTRSRR